MIDRLRECAQFRARDASVLAAVLVFSAFLRALEWSGWQGAEFWLESNPLQASEDAYAWLAGAVGSGRLAGWPLAELIARVSAVTGISEARVAFWMPAALAGMAPAMVASICIFKGYRWAALVSGFFLAGSLGYLARTRLGYVDTDPFALALPIALAMCWAMTIQSLSRSRSGGGRLASPGWLLATLVVVSVYQWLYPSGYALALAVLGCGAVYALLVLPRPVWGAIFLALALGLLCAHFGWLGLLISLVIAVAAVYVSRLTAPAYGLVVLVAAGVIVLIFDAAFLAQTIARIAAYLPLNAPVGPISDWQLPRVDGSIQETGALSLMEFSQRAAVHWVFLVVGLVGFAVALHRWPYLVTFLPLAVVGISSLWLGNRFAMYLSPVVALGLGLGLASMLERRWPESGWRWLPQGGFVMLIVVVLVLHAQDMRPVPVLERNHAHALSQLSGLESDRARVWSWWDLGYATQYYTGLPTLADGASASRQRLFAMGQVYGSADPARAAHLMRFLATERHVLMQTSADWREVTYAHQPLGSLTHIPAAGMDRKLAGLRVLHTAVPESSLPDEFLVVSWDLLKRGSAISEGGRWSLRQGSADPGQLAKLSAPVEFDERNGVLATQDGDVPLISIDILEESSRFHESWPRTEGAHAVINNVSGEGLLMDSSVYQTLAVQFLIGEAGEFAADFDLAVDDFPAARVYRLKHR